MESSEPIVSSCKMSAGGVYIFSVARAVGSFFFFQAEDGIRDKLVTGVQTCALPICRPVEHDPFALFCSAVLEAAAHEKKTEQTKNRAAENQIRPPRSRSIESRRDRKPPITGVAAWLPSCH